MFGRPLWFVEEDVVAAANMMGTEQLPPRGGTHSRPDMSEVLPPPPYRKIMAPTDIARPSFRNATSKSAGYAAALTSASNFTPRGFTTPGPAGGGRVDMLVLDAAEDDDDGMPSIHRLFSKSADVERKTCSLEYWLSIFGTTGGTVHEHHHRPSGARSTCVSGIIIGRGARL